MGSLEETKKINLVRIAHVYYKHKDVKRQSAFLEDFGFSEVCKAGKKSYWRGYSEEPFVYCLEEGETDEFGGTAFVVESEDDLHYAAKTLPSATEVYEMEDSPGGGKCVTFKDPVDGFPFHLVHGQTPIPPENVPSLPYLSFNFPHEKSRPKNKTQRLEKRPAPVHKLGHFGMVVTDFAKTFEFYTSRFNFFPSELIHDDTGRNITAFNRLARGKEQVDHHCFFFFEGPKSHVHHASFETHDFDTQVLGHDWLRHKGYENCWGVGRHIMGSQIFDYWFDPSKFILEHYVDGDLLDETEETAVGLASPDNLHVWGPEVPSSFLS